MKRIAIATVLLCCSCMATYDTTREPGITSAAPLAAAPQVVHDPPADTSALRRLGTVHVQTANVQTQAQCEEKVITAAKKELGGDVFYERHVDGVWGSGPACEVVAYARVNR